MTDKKQLTDPQFVELLTHEMAIAWADEIRKGPRTAAEKQSVGRMKRSARILIAELRQRAFAERCRGRPDVVKRPVPPRILAMTRDELISRVRALNGQAVGAAVVAFRQADRLELDDLRALVTDLEDTLDSAG